MNPGSDEEVEGPSTSLSPRQRANLDRFTRKLPTGHEPVIIEKRPDGARAFTSEVPGRVPGSKAIYRKEVDAEGRTTGYRKTTITPDGKVMHVKDKFSSHPDVQ